MKKRINNKIYDTDKAHLVFCFTEGQGPSFYEEALYKKRTGEFFLHVCGGAESKFHRPLESGSWEGNEDIIPMIVEEARRWLEANSAQEIYDNEFGEISEVEGRIAISITLPKAMVERIKRNAAKSSISMSAYIERCIDKEPGG